MVSSNNYFLYLRKKGSWSTTTKWSNLDFVRKDVSIFNRRCSKVSSTSLSSLSTHQMALEIQIILKLSRQKKLLTSLPCWEFASTPASRTKKAVQSIASFTVSQMSPPKGFWFGFSAGQQFYLLKSSTVCEPTNTKHTDNIVREPNTTSKFCTINHPIRSKTRMNTCN